MKDLLFFTFGAGVITLTYMLYRMWAYRLITIEKIPLRYSILSKMLLWNNRWLAVKLLDWSKETPYTHIGNYMHRWWLIQHPAEPHEPGYGTLRDKLRRYYPFYARFHNILRADSDRHCHDHPMEFYSIILQGWYEEERLMEDGTIRAFFYNEGSVNHAKPGQYHRIKKVSDGGVLTFVIHDKKAYNSWGFLVDGKRVHWKDYFAVGCDENIVAVKPDEPGRLMPHPQHAAKNIVAPRDTKDDYMCMGCHVMGKLLLTGNDVGYTHVECKSCGVRSTLNPRIRDAENLHVFDTDKYYFAAGCDENLELDVKDRVYIDKTLEKIAEVSRVDLESEMKAIHNMREDLIAFKDDYGLDESRKILHQLGINYMYQIEFSMHDAFYKYLNEADERLSGETH